MRIHPVFGNKFFWSSCVFHALGFFVCLLSFFHKSTVSSERSDFPPINSYAFTSLPSVPLQKTFIKKSTLSITHKRPPKPFHAESTAVNKESKKSPDALLDILHRAIAAKQTYPESAFLAQQSGTVKIGFWLYPTGDIKSISLIKTCGYHDIDLAALNAMQSLGTINAAHRYLTEARYFSIDIEFR